MYFKPAKYIKTRDIIAARDDSESFSPYVNSLLDESVTLQRGFDGIERFAGECAENPEGYALIYDKSNAKIFANTDRAALYALGTLDALKADKADACFIVDKPDRPIRGYRVYLPGRAHFSEFFKMVDTIVKYRFNAMIIEIGGAMQYDKHPEINEKWKEFALDMHSHSGRCHEVQFAYSWEKNSIHVDNGEGDVLTKDEIKALIDYIRARGLEIIPEVPTLSHSDYIVMPHPELAERREDPYPDTYCPSDERSYEIVSDILGEVIELFKPKYINIGHDECYTIGLCDKCKGTPPEVLYTRDITRIHDILAGYGVQTLMWGEKLLDCRDQNGEKCGGAGIDGRVPPLFGCAKLLPRDITMLHWYWVFDKKNDRTYHENGYRVLFSNFTAVGCKAYRERVNLGIKGGFVSNWGSNEAEYMQRNKQFIDLIFTAAAFWSGNYDDDKRGEYYYNARRELYSLYSSTLGENPIEILHTTQYDIGYKYFYDGIFIEDDIYTLGYYEVLYEDGESARLPVRYGTNISNDGIEIKAGSSRSDEMTYSVMSETRRDKTWYRTSWKNPKPEVAIKAVRFVKTIADDAFSGVEFALTSVQ